MARSNYIYIVIEGAEIIGAFTVKHELIAFLQRQNFIRFEVKRLRDGWRDTLGSKEDVTDQIKREILEA